MVRWMKCGRDWEGLYGMMGSFGIVTQCLDKAGTKHAKKKNLLADYMD